MHGRLRSDCGRAEACIVASGVRKCRFEETLAMLPRAMSKRVARHARRGHSHGAIHRGSHYRARKVLQITCAL